MCWTERNCQTRDSPVESDASEEEGCSCAILGHLEDEQKNLFCTIFFLIIVIIITIILTISLPKLFLSLKIALPIYLTFLSL